MKAEFFKITFSLSGEDQMVFIIWPTNMRHYTNSFSYMQHFSSVYFWNEPNLAMVPYAFIMMQDSGVTLEKAWVYSYIIKARFPAEPLDQLDGYLAVSGENYTHPTRLLQELQKNTQNKPDTMGLAYDRYSNCPAAGSITIIIHFPSVVASRFSKL